MAGRDHTPRDLLFGLLALHTGLIDQDQLLTAFGVWSRAKGNTLAQILVERGSIDEEERALLAGMAEKQLKKHAGDTEKSLASLTLGPSTLDKLSSLGDTDLTASIAFAGLRTPGHEATATMSVGASTSEGQRFRVLRPHAKGGLGAVFVALDGELNREVALKQILDHHADDPNSRTRFLIEAEITGGLEHPGIVPVYGLGRYNDGRPFYAMRFIRGDSLKEAIAAFHADESLKRDPGKKSLALHKLLRRFIDVCNAIDYAHNRGILHRDLKPANVILGKHGETLVVDWGLAKALGRPEIGSLMDERTLMPSSSSGSAETLPGSALGTPAYMSPEQASGDLVRLGPRSDVYSLGATLYCLLTGKPPFEGDDLGTMLREVQKGAFPTPRQVDPSIDKALEAVCLKAMSVKPEARYTTARSLADDIERWAAEEPVSAWQEPASIQARRWMRRNRTLVTAGAVTVMMGIVGLAAVLVVQTKSKAALEKAYAEVSEAQGFAAGFNESLKEANADLRESLAREEKANADLTNSRVAVQARYDLAVAAIKTFHTGVSEDFLLKEDKFKDLRDRLLKSASDFYGKLNALLGKGTDFASRRALAQSNFELAKLTEKVGRKENALEAHRAVLATRESLAAEPEASVESQADVGRSLTEVANILYAIGKADEALATYRRAESLLMGQARPEPSVRAALAECRMQMAVLLRYAGRYSEALAACRLARDDQVVLASAPGASIDARHELAETIDTIGYMLWMTNKPAEAVLEFRSAMPIFRKLADENSSELEFRLDLGRTHFYLGNVLPLTGKTDEGEAEFRRSLEIGQKLVDENPSLTRLRRYLGLSRNYLGDLLSWTGKPTEAEAEVREAMAIFRRMADDDPDVPELRSMLAWAHRSLGRLLRKRGRMAEATIELHKARVLWQSLADDYPAIKVFALDLISLLNALGDAARSLGRASEAKDFYDLAIARNNPQGLEDSDDIHLQQALNYSIYGRGLALGDLGDVAEAAIAARRALRTFEALASPSGPDQFQKARCHSTLAGLGGRFGSGVSAAEGEIEAKRAMELLREAVAMGYRDTDELRIESALDPLRSRPDFQFLMMDLAFPARPFLE